MQGTLGIARNLRNASENKQSDRADRDTVMQSDDAVTELVKQHRAKKQKAGNYADSPLPPAAPILIVLGKSAGQ